VEPLSNLHPRRRRAWVIHGVVLLVLLSGPTVVSFLTTGITSVVTWPITRSLRFESNQFEIFNATLLMTYLIAVIGLNIAFRAGVLSIGHSAFVALGAYSVGILTTQAGWPFISAVVVGVLLCAVIGFVLSLPALRLGLFTLAMVTLGYAFIAHDLAVEWRGLTGGGDGLRGVSRPGIVSDVSAYYWLVLVALVLSYGLARKILRSPFGRSARAASLNVPAAQFMGINDYFTKTASFVISGMFAGLSGALFAPLVGFISPDALSVHLAVLILVMVLIGGAGTVAGPVLGAVILFRIPIELTRVVDDAGSMTLLFYGLVLLGTIILFPQGFIGGWWRLRARLERTRWLSDHASHPTTTSVPEGETSSRISSLIVEGGLSGDSENGPTGESATESAPVLEARGVSCTVGGVQAVRGLDMTVRSGEVHALIGPNGAGKTTFLNSVCGYVMPHEGSIVVKGQDITTWRPHARARLGVGRTYQTPLIFEEDSCIDNLVMALDRSRSATRATGSFLRPQGWREERRQYERAGDVLAAFGLADRAHAAAGNLPPGGRRSIELARIVGMEPDLVLLDEPAAGLSSSEILELGQVIEALRAAGVAVLLVEHNMGLVMKVADRVTVIDFGQLITAGPPEAVRANPLVQEAYLGTTARQAGGPTTD
jgi:ABC-type branched-subunit amino acid transport system ATPase component/ABC-type branched-subunit amino acid transport system permease subunit